MSDIERLLKELLDNEARRPLPALKQLESMWRAAGRESGRGGTETSGREPAQDTGAAAKSAAHIESGEALERRGWEPIPKSAARRSAVPPPRER